MTLKTCTQCKKDKPPEDFYKQQQGRNGLRASCKKCVIKQTSKKKDPVKARRYTATSLARFKEKHGYSYQRWWRLNSKYGLSIEDYDALNSAQNGLCAICGKPDETFDRYGNQKILAVDHCHKTGAIRSLLCSGCNLGIGFMQDDPDRLEAAAAYLRSHRGSI